MPNNKFKISFERLKKIASNEISNCIKSLPPELKEQAENLPVIFYARPTTGMIKDGIERDLLGLFIGKSFSEEFTHHTEVPSQIILFIDNIIDYADYNLKNFKIEIQKTYLHEAGHYLGFTEEDLELRNMD